MTKLLKLMFVEIRRMFSNFFLGLVRTAMRKLGWKRPTGDSTDVDTPYGLHELEENRKSLFRDAIKLFILSASRPTHEHYGDCNLMCRLKGVNRSILQLDSFVTKAEVVGSNQCRLTDNHENTAVVNCIGDD
ncbi:uncharacterized protein LOC126847909 isoform X1 [Adelges cooleyi]|uniref:uncharacterized protein LOC126847909 isoform X1 n=2 Tax=Adelges cooleyi TaxID=133065 RepID=UPI00217F4DF9|nr:uncharacterized protein LOC126847909 isoform X1 [Adelges cooleyi]